MNDPWDIEGMLYKEPPKVERIFVGVDSAGPSGDATATVVMGLGADGRYYVLDTLIKRQRAKWRDQMFLLTLATFALPVGLWSHGPLAVALSMICLGTIARAVLIEGRMR